MALAPNLPNREMDSFLEVSGQTSRAVCNPDGTPINSSVELTEFPTAAALSENFANPTTTTIGAMNMVWDGATWDRLPGNSTDGALVNLGANNDVTANATPTASATLSSVAVSASSTQLLAANSSRAGVIIHNNTSVTLYVKFGTTATASIGGYTYAVGASGHLTLPEAGQKMYTGRIDGIWASATGSGASITEL